VQQIGVDALVLPSSVLDFENPDIDKYLVKYVRGSHGIGYRERIKIMKLCGTRSVPSSADATSSTR
jgi:4-hydroxyphenylacetate 3-monooxygenase